MASPFMTISDGLSNIRIYRHRQDGTDIPAGIGNQMTFRAPIMIHHLAKPTIYIDFTAPGSTNWDVDLLPIDAKSSTIAGMNSYSLGTAFTAVGRTRHVISALPTGFAGIEVLIWQCLIRITNQDAVNELKDLHLTALGCDYGKQI